MLRRPRRLRFIFAIALCSIALAVPGRAAAQSRPKIGLALGGGSARGLAHVGVLRWLEEHHVPADLIAGTSIGGLIGGAYASGMTPTEIEALIAGTDWIKMFGDGNFSFMNVRRKRDARAYPSHLEYGLKHGIVAPPALNNGQEVEFMLARIAAPYFAAATFDDLPTPFRCVAVDLKTAKAVVLDRGSLAAAMRATMSLPLVFPPVALDNLLLVDGGALNNVPADVARDMGATTVIAVNVGDLSDDPKITPSFTGLLSSTLDAMMRANTRRTLGSADVVVNVAVTTFGSLDWGRYPELIRAGYDAAEAMKTQLLPLALDDAAWQRWASARSGARRTSLPSPSFVRIDGAVPADEDRIRRVFEARLGQSLDFGAIETALTELGGLERYETMTWQLVADGAREGLLIRAVPKSYGPPFFFLAASLENTTSDDFRFGLSGRYLAFDHVVSGSELRVDVAVGSDPSAAAALYLPISRTPFFVEFGAGAAARTLNLIANDHVVATYGQRRITALGETGINIGRLDDVRVGARVGHQRARPRIGDPGLPELTGRDSAIHARWTHDGQDSPILPTRGLLASASVQRFLTAPPVPDGVVTTRRTEGVTQAEVQASRFWSFTDGQVHRVFVAGGAGTSFDGAPFPTEQFALGGPLRLGAFNVGERRGDHYGLLTAGYLRQIGRLPDLFGGAILLGGWLETGSAFDRRVDASIATHASAGMIADTLIGPVFAGISTDLNGGGSRFYIGIGRLLR